MQCYLFAHVTRYHLRHRGCNFEVTMNIVLGILNQFVHWLVEVMLR